MLIQIIIIDRMAITKKQILTEKLASPSSYALPYINMHKGFVQSKPADMNAATVYRIDRRVNFLRGHVTDFNIGGIAKHMLTVFCAAYRCIVVFAAPTADNRDRPVYGPTDKLKHFY